MKRVRSEKINSSANNNITVKTHLPDIIMWSRKSITVLLILSVLLLIVISCKKKPDIEISNNKIVIGQTTIYSTSYRLTQVTTIISDLGGNLITNYGHCWSLNQNPTTSEPTKTIRGILNQAGSFTSDLDNLSPGKKYFVRSYVTYQNGTVYGAEISFNTSETANPIVTTTDISNITNITAQSGGNVIDDGNTSISAKGVVWSISQNPTIESNAGLTTDGSGSGSFSSLITGLSAKTSYYVRSYATNSHGTSYGEIKQFESDLNTITDSRDGQIYKIVEIGSQTWFAENLAYLPAVSPSSTNYAFSFPYYYVSGYEGYDVNTAKETDNYSIFGVLYNWNAAMNGVSSSSTIPSNVQGACPDGWHMPSDAEWKQLEMFIGMSQFDADKIDYRGTNEGEKLKSKSGWYYNGNGTDIYNFRVLPGGDMSPNNFLGYVGLFWTSTEINTTNAWYRMFGCDNKGIYRRSNHHKGQYHSVRCVKN